MFSLININAKVTNTILSNQIYQKGQNYKRENYFIGFLNYVLTYECMHIKYYAHNPYILA